MVAPVLRLVVAAEELPVLRLVCAEEVLPLERVVELLERLVVPLWLLELEEPRLVRVFWAMELAERDAEAPLDRLGLVEIWAERLAEEPPDRLMEEEPREVRLRGRNHRYRDEEGGYGVDHPSHGFVV